MSSRISLILFTFSFVTLAVNSRGQQTTSSATGKQGSVPEGQAATKPAPGQATAQPAAAPTANTIPRENLSATAWKLLQMAMESDKARSRSDALSALTILPSNTKATALIEDRLEDKEESIRVLAAISLGDIKARSAIPALKKDLDDPSAQLSFAAAQALWKMGDRSGRDIFYAVLDGERKTSPGLIKSKMRMAKQELHDPKALALIGVNEASGAFLGPFSMGVSMIEEYAKDSSAPVQAVCAQLLAMDDSRRTTDELEYALWDKNWAVRAAAARAIAKLNDRKALKQLTDMMMNDKQDAARLVAAAAIIQLGGENRAAGTHRNVPPTAPDATPGDAPTGKAAKPL
jgi:HEAT repeat protein